MTNSYKDDKKRAAIVKNSIRRADITKQYNLPTSIPGCTNCNNLTKEICSTILGQFTYKRLSTLPNNTIDSINQKIKYYLKNVSQINCIDRMYGDQNLTDNSMYIVCDKHLAFSKEQGTNRRGRQLITKNLTIIQITQKEIDIRKEIQTGCTDCLDLRKKLKINEVRAAVYNHDNTVSIFLIKLKMLVQEIKELEFQCAQERKIQRIKNHTELTKSHSQNKKNKEEEKKADRPQNDNVAYSGFSKEEKENLDMIYLHKGRKYDISKYGTDHYNNATHRTTREGLINGIKYCLQHPNEHFSYQYKIESNGKSRKNSNTMIFCMNCFCHKKVGDTVFKCNHRSPIKDLLNRLSTIPNSVSNKKEILQEVDALKIRLNNIEIIFGRDHRFEKLLKTNPLIVKCLHCEGGIADLFKEKDRELLKLDDYYREQDYIRECDTCNTVFCCKKNKFNGIESVCSTRYYRGESYVPEEKSDDPRIDHRKNTCLKVHTNNDDSDMKVIGDLCKACPHCNNAVMLQDGCNSIQCACNKYFCWLCNEGFVIDSKTRKPQLNKEGKKIPMTTSEHSHTHSAHCSGAGGNFFHRIGK